MMVEAEAVADSDVHLDESVYDRQDVSEPVEDELALVSKLAR